MRLLAGQVGPAGRVTGVDSDGRLGREGLEMLQATVPGPERFAFVETDVEAAGADAARSFPGYPFRPGVRRNRRHGQRPTPLRPVAAADQRLEAPTR
jgi:hypothetical protein